MRDVRRNTTFFEYYVCHAFERTNRLEVLQILRKLVDTCYRIDISEIVAYAMIALFIKDGSLRQF